MWQKLSGRKEKNRKVFLDTNVVLSFVFLNDEHHKRTVNFLNQFAEIYYISPMTLFELYCVIPRKFGNVRFPVAVQRLLNKYETEEEKMACVSTLVVSYFKHSLPKEVIFCSDEKFEWTLRNVEVDDSTIKIFEPYYLAVQKGHKLLQKAADALHLAYVSKAAQNTPVCFITFDEDIFEKAQAIKQEINVEIRRP